MKNTGLLLLMMLFVLLFTGTSCDKEPDCKNCSAVQVLYEDGVEIQSENIPAVEYCDAELRGIEQGSPIIAIQNVGGVEYKTITTYTCE